MSTAPKIKHVHYDETCPIMDRDQIDTLILGDEGNSDTTLVHELFDLFVNESAAKLEALPAACAQGDLLELRNIVHFIVGSACHLGLVRLAAFYRAIERAVDEQQLNDIAEVAAPILREFELAREAFRADFKLLETSFASMAVACDWKAINSCFTTGNKKYTPIKFGKHIASNIPSEKSVTAPSERADPTTMHAQKSN
jgi:HPt (histidine-containing phosphotransfer) domain-containing protein